MSYLWAGMVFACQEALGLIVFPVLNHYMGKRGEGAWDAKQIVKGILERLVLLFALVHGYPQMLIAFAAMKLGTRLRDDEDRITNTNFLVGNLLSMFLAMAGAVVVRSIWEAKGWS